MHTFGSGMPHLTSRLSSHSRRRYRWLALTLLALCAAIGTWAVFALLYRDGAPVLYATTLPLPPGQDVTLAVNAVTRRAFVAGSGGRVCVLDLDSGALLHTVAVESSSGVPDVSVSVHVLADARSGHVFVSISDGGLSLLDARSGRPLATLSPAQGPGALALDKPGGRLFVRAGDGNVSGWVGAFDARSGQPLAINPVPIEVDASTGGLALDGQHGRGFAADDAGGVAQFDTRTGNVLHDTHGSPNPFTDLAVDTRAGLVFAVGDDTGNVSVFDARTDALLPTVPLLTLPTAIAVDTRTGRAFASDAGGTVSVIDTRRLSALRDVTVGASPLMALDARRGRVLVASASGLRLLDTRSGALVGIYQRAWSPLAVVVDERTGRALVVNAVPAAHPSDPWAWLPRPLRRLLPFIPPPRRSHASVQLVALDEGALNKPRG